MQIFVNYQRSTILFLILIDTVLQFFFVKRKHSLMLWLHKFYILNLQCLNLDKDTFYGPFCVGLRRLYVSENSFWFLNVFYGRNPIIFLTSRKTETESYEHINVKN